MEWVIESRLSCASGLCLTLRLLLALSHKSSACFLRPAVPEPLFECLYLYALLRGWQEKEM